MSTPRTALLRLFILMTLGLAAATPVRAGIPNLNALCTSLPGKLSGLIHRDYAIVRSMNHHGFRIRG